MMVTTSFIRNQKNKTEQHKIVGGFMKHLTKIKDVLNTNEGAIKQQKKRDKFPRHQKTEIKQKKTKQTFLRHATGKVQQPRKTKRFRIKKMEKKEYKVNNYLTGKLQQLNTTERYRTYKIEKKQQKVNIISQATFHNRRQKTDYEERRSKRNSTRPSISQARFHY